MGRPLDESKRRALAACLGIGRGRRHIFLCTLPTKPKCAPHEVSAATWAHLKKRIVELGLDGKLVAGGQAAGVDGRCVHRSKVDCLRVCADGPIAVVYPDGVWYRGVTPEVMERILVEHVLGERPVEEHVLAVDPLTVDES